MELPVKFRCCLGSMLRSLFGAVHTWCQRNFQDFRPPLSEPNSRNLPSFSQNWLPPPPHSTNVIYVWRLWLVSNITETGRSSSNRNKNFAAWQYMKVITCLLYLQAFHRVQKTTGYQLKCPVYNCWIKFLVTNILISSDCSSKLTCRLSL